MRSEADGSVYVFHHLNTGPEPSDPEDVPGIGIHSQEPEPDPDHEHPSGRSENWGVPAVNGRRN